MASLIPDQNIPFFIFKLNQKFNNFKQVLITIAALVLVGCGPSVDIHEAARTGNIEAVKQHLDAETDVDVRSFIAKETPLHEAAGNGHKEIVELLIAKGADVNANSLRRSSHQQKRTYTRP